MAEVNQNRFGGEWMVQDSDHMSGIPQAAEDASLFNARQADQAQSGGRQQGGNDQGAGRQQGGENQSSGRQQGGARRSR